MTDSLRPRIYKFDNVKFLCILLVVIGQFADSYSMSSDMFQSWFVFVYSFHAPLFIFLSGLFQKQYKDGVKLNIRKICFYIVLGFIMKLLIFGMRRLAGEDVGLELFGGATVEWYLFVDAMYMLTAYLVRRVNRFVVLAAAPVLGLLVGFTPLQDEFYLSRYFVFMVFYFAGYYLTPVSVRKFTHRLNVKFTGIGFMFVYFVICFRWRELIYPFRMLFTGRNPYALVPIEGCTFYHRLLCYGISAILVIAMIACIPNRRIPIISKMGANTLGVYFWHYPLELLLVTVGYFSLIEQLDDPMWKLAVLFSAIFFGVILSFGIFSYPLKKLGELFNRMPLWICLPLTGTVITAAACVSIFILN